MMTRNRLVLAAEVVVKLVKGCGMDDVDGKSADHDSCSVPIEGLLEGGEGVDSADQLDHGSH